MDNHGTGAIEISGYPHISDSCPVLPALFLFFLSLSFGTPGLPFSPFSWCSPVFPVGYASSSFPCVGGYSKHFFKKKKQATRSRFHEPSLYRMKLFSSGDPGDKFTGNQYRYEVPQSQARLCHCQAHLTIFRNES